MSGIVTIANDGDNPIPVTSGNIGQVNSGNSSSTPLGAGGVFTGSSVDILNYSIVAISVFSDQESAADGLSIQQSSDGTNWRFTDEYTIPANTGKVYSVQTSSRYFRIVYTNGATPQTVFDLSVILKEMNTKPSSHRIKDTIVGNDDAELVKAALTGVNGDGTWYNVKTTTDGNLATVDRGNGLSIASGEVTGSAFIHKFGQAPDFDISDGFVTIWDGADDAGINQMNYVLCLMDLILKLSIFFLNLIVGYRH